MTRRAEWPRLAWLNQLPAEAAQTELLACCSSGRWAERMVRGRPYTSLDDVLRRSDAEIAGLSEAGLQTALAGHPRIGEGAEPAGGSQAAAWSRQEQSGMRDADEETRRELEELNLAYEQRFGHVYLVCASGRRAAELLALLRARLHNDEETEWRVVNSELQQITQIRLRELLAHPA